MHIEQAISESFETEGKDSPGVVFIEAFPGRQDESHELPKHWDEPSDDFPSLTASERIEEVEENDA